MENLELLQQEMSKMGDLLLDSYNHFSKTIVHMTKKLAEKNELQKKLDECSELREFVKNVDIDTFKRVSEFYKYSLDCHYPQYCKTHKKEFVYQDNDGINWYSADTEDDIEEDVVNMFRQGQDKVYPCCKEYSDGEGEEESGEYIDEE